MRPSIAQHAMPKEMYQRLLVRARSKSCSLLMNSIEFSPVSRSSAI